MGNGDDTGDLASGDWRLSGWLGIGDDSLDLVQGKLSRQWRLRDWGVKTTVEI